jgi:hypothetical protein
MENLILHSLVTCSVLRTKWKIYRCLVDWQPVRGAFVSLYCPQDRGCGHVPNALRANRAYLAFLCVCTSVPALSWGQYRPVGWGVVLAVLCWSTTGIHACKLQARTNPPLLRGQLGLQFGAALLREVRRERTRVWRGVRLVLGPVEEGRSFCVSVCFSSVHHGSRGADPWGRATAGGSIRGCAAPGAIDGAAGRSWVIHGRADPRGTWPSRASAPAAPPAALVVRARRHRGRADAPRCAAASTAAAAAAASTAYAPARRGCARWWVRRRCGVAARVAVGAAAAGGGHACCWSVCNRS